LVLKTDAKHSQATAAIAFPPKPIIPMLTVFKKSSDWGNGQVEKI
jgi:hypothetical protein